MLEPDAPCPRILVVDDEAAMTKVLCDILTEQGYETVGLSTGTAALEALRESGFDLLLADMNMPGMDGIALLQAALKIDPNLVGVIMTGEGTIGTAVEAMKTGATDYILKPFELSVILPVLSRAVTVRRLRVKNAELERRVRERTAELEAANKLKDELILREREVVVELERIREREAQTGFRIQQTLLLDQPPADIAGLRVAALTVPSQRIDGDFYIFIKHQNQCLDVIVGDVMGKGTPAALLGAATKSHFFKALSDLTARSKQGVLPEPKEITMLAHAGVVRHLIELESFVTLCYARINVRGRTLDLVDCGHTGIVHLHAKTGLCQVLHGDNLPLGVRAGEIYEQISIPVETGDLLLLYSDGITEARNPAREPFGSERLEECVRANGQNDPGTVVEAIRKSVFTFSQSRGLADDLTTVAIRVEDVRLPVARKEIDIQSDLGQLCRTREFVRVFCHDLPGTPVDEDSVNALELAVNEAASNIMKHAYHGRTDQWIHVEGEAFPGEVSIRLHHLGEPFDPSTAPAPTLDGSRDSGLGTTIIARTVDEVRYSVDERGRSCIALRKLL